MDALEGRERSRRHALHQGVGVLVYLAADDERLALLLERQEDGFDRPRLVVERRVVQCRPVARVSEVEAGVSGCQQLERLHVAVESGEEAGGSAGLFIGLVDLVLLLVVAERRQERLQNTALVVDRRLQHGISVGWGRGLHLPESREEPSGGLDALGYLVVGGDGLCIAEAEELGLVDKLGEVYPDVSVPQLQLL